MVTKIIFLYVSKCGRGGFSVLVRGVADSKQSEPKNFATPPAGDGKFYRGVATINPQTYKHRADI
jgi:hypothetical protein